MLISSRIWSFVMRAEARVTIMGEASFGGRELLPRGPIEAPRLAFVGAALIATCGAWGCAEAWPAMANALWEAGAPCCMPN